MKVKNPFRAKKKLRQKKLKLGEKHFSEDEFELHYLQQAFDLEAKRKIWS